MVNKMSPQIIHMIDELMEKSWQMQNNADDAAADEYGYSFEPDDVISAEPLDFYESAMLLQSQAADLYRLVCLFNRHSPLFVKVSSLMEKVVRRLGVFCITKAVLEQDGNDFRMLDKLNVGWLRSITAFNVRKCYAAYMEDRRNNCFPGDVMDLSFRWNVLDKRLIATEEKIGKIKAGTVSVSTDHGERSVSAGTAGPVPDAEGSASGVFTALSGARAFPVDKAAVSLNRQTIEPESDPCDEPRDPDSLSKDGSSVECEISGNMAGSESEPYAQDDAVFPAGVNNTDAPDASDPDEASTAEKDRAEPDLSGLVEESELPDVLYPENSFYAGPVPNLSDWVIRHFVEKHYPSSRPEKLTGDRERAASPPKV